MSRTIRTASRRVTGHFVRGRREELGLTQEDIAVATRTTRAYVGMVESGRTGISAPRVLDWARALQLKPLDLCRVQYDRGHRAWLPYCRHCGVVIRRRVAPGYCTAKCRDADRGWS